VVIDGKCRGVVMRDLSTGKISSYFGHAVLLCTGGYGNVYYLSTNAKNSNASAAWRAYKRGALFANPSFVQVHPTCIPQSGEHQSKLTLMSESLRNDGRVWVPRNKGDKRHPNDIPEADRYYFLEERYPSFGNLVPRDVASRNAKNVCDMGLGVGATGLAVYLDFRDSINRMGKKVVEEKYGNLFDMYKQITAEDPYSQPMRIYPAVHYTMGGLWVDYNLMTNIPGLYALGEANFSDHGANRLGASALMQGLADGYFVIPYTLGDYLAGESQAKIGTDHEAFKTAEAEVNARIQKLLSINGKHTVDELHRQLGKIVWDNCGMARTADGLKSSLLEIQKIKEKFWTDVRVLGTNEEVNQSLEKALRVADFIELAELMCIDALDRNESCGCHLREEYQTPEGEARRNDDEFCYVAAWGYQGDGTAPSLTKEALAFENVKLVQRSYK